MMSKRFPTRVAIAGAMVLTIAALYAVEETGSPMQMQGLLAYTPADEFQPKEQSVGTLEEPFKAPLQLHPDSQMPPLFEAKDAGETPRRTTARTRSTQHSRRVFSNMPTVMPKDIDPKMVNDPGRSADLGTLVVVPVEIGLPARRETN